MELRTLCTQQHLKLKCLSGIILLHGGLLSGSEKLRLENSELCWRTPVLPDPRLWLFTERNVEMQRKKILEDQSNLKRWTEYETFLEEEGINEEGWYCFFPHMNAKSIVGFFLSSGKKGICSNYILLTQNNVIRQAVFLVDQHPKLFIWALYISQSIQESIPVGCKT